MIIATVSFRDGRLVESDPSDEISVLDIKRSLAYAFLYDYTVNVYSNNLIYRDVKVIAIKFNENGNLFFTGVFSHEKRVIKKSFSWREINYIDININKDPESYY